MAAPNPAPRADPMVVHFHQPPSLPFIAQRIVSRGGSDIDALPGPRRRSSLCRHRALIDTDARDPPIPCLARADECDAENFRSEFLRDQLPGVKPRNERANGPPLQSWPSIPFPGKRGPPCPVTPSENHPAPQPVRAFPLTMLLATRQLPPLGRSWGCEALPARPPLQHHEQIPSHPIISGPVAGLIPVRRGYCRSLPNRDRPEEEAA
jgi:hypothetical protein